ncbi:MAG: ABC transporter substrate-binding protein [Rhodospirillaceae bacterium]|uniref:amino acid ABC transporter substrate-binding protein n=1 Tax=Hwanghaeella sp. 1Z406 TaxID=3402811 RepID=UPI000C59F266|nr:ABC transporter substrate-binding protein [Rhodospirillales bacterium]MAX47692.1 ABC transporter substrate-binding protein [Rhodospirillaceae bacterium]|tara:strand:- start:1249 stop:2457 length:1209 start_codon:yes stop_codon:yes gene_type:complete
MGQGFVRRLQRGAIALSVMTLGMMGHAGAEDGVIKIGAPLALSGGLASEGAKQKLAYDLWLERINALGGIDVGGVMMPVELITYDYQTDGKRAGQLAEKLIIDDKVDFLTAPFGSGHTKITAGVAERYGVPIIAVASSEPVHNQGYKNLFGTLAPSGGLIDGMLDLFTAKKPDLKKMAIYGRDDVFPKIMASLMSKAATARGIEVVYEELYPVGTLDHSAATVGMRAAKPDWIYVTGYTGDLVLVRKQMEEQGINAPIVTMITGPAYREFVENLGPLAENVTSATWWHYSADYSGDDVFGTTQAFYDAVVKASGEEPDYVHASSAAALIALQKAIETAGTLDRDAVRTALQNLDIETFYGPISFREDGLNDNRNLPIIQIQDGKPVILSPANLATAEMRLNQ